MLYYYGWLLYLYIVRIIVCWTFCVLSITVTLSIIIIYNICACIVYISNYKRNSVQVYSVLLWAALFVWIVSNFIDRNLATPAVSISSNEGSSFDIRFSHSPIFGNFDCSTSKTEQIELTVGTHTTSATVRCLPATYSDWLRKISRNSSACSISAKRGSTRYSISLSWKTALSSP